MNKTNNFMCTCLVGLSIDIHVHMNYNKYRQEAGHTEGGVPMTSKEFERLTPEERKAYWLEYKKRLSPKA